MKRLKLIGEGKKYPTDRFADDAPGSGTVTKAIKDRSESNLSNLEKGRMRKFIRKYSSPSCIGKNGCKVHRDLQGADDENLKMKYEVSTWVREYLKENRESISGWLSDVAEDGLVVLPNVFRREDVQNDAEELLRFFRCSQNILRDINDQDESFWVTITNAPDGNPRTHLRYQTVKGAYSWLKAKFPQKLRLKLKIDLYMASLTECLGVLGNQGVHESPRYGSTMLLSQPGCAEQIPHTDYASSYFKFSSDKTPGYFLMFGGRNGMRLNIWRGSHLASLTKIPEELQEQLGNTFKKEVLFVSPRDAVICRGDLVHSGTAYPREEKMAGVRYHLMFDREDMQVDDIIEPREEFMRNEKGDLTLEIGPVRRRSKGSCQKTGRKRKRTLGSR